MSYPDPLMVACSVPSRNHPSAGEVPFHSKLESTPVVGRADAQKLLHIVLACAFELRIP